MSDKAKEYRALIDRMLNEMGDDVQFLKTVYTIVHRHFIRKGKTVPTCRNEENVLGVINLLTNTSKSVMQAQIKSLPSLPEFKQLEQKEKDKVELVLELIMQLHD